MTVSLFYAVAVICAIAGAAIYVSDLLSRQGIVSGIFYSVESSAAVVDGYVLTCGDIINGATIVKISRFDVEFEKNGKRWKQKVKEKPNPLWRNPDGD